MARRGGAGGDAGGGQQPDRARLHYEEERPLLQAQAGEALQEEQRQVGEPEPDLERGTVLKLNEFDPNVLISVGFRYLFRSRLDAVKWK